MSTCVKPDVTCVVCSVRRMHGAGYGQEEHVLAWRTPRIARFVFFYARVTSWLHVWCGIRQEGVIPCRMVPSRRGEVHVQLDDVTGEVQQARLIVAVQRCAMCELPRWTRS